MYGKATAPASLSQVNRAPITPKASGHTPYAKPSEGWDVTACCPIRPPVPHAAAMSATKRLIDDASARLPLRAGVTAVEQPLPAVREGTAAA